MGDYPYPDSEMCPADWGELAREVHAAGGTPPAEPTSLERHDTAICAVGRSYFRSGCSCGWESGTRRLRSRADADATEHRRRVAVCEHGSLRSDCCMRCLRPGDTPRPGDALGTMPEGRPCW